MTVLRLFAVLLAGAVLASMASRPAAAVGGQVGVLTCKSVPGTRFNLIIHSAVDVDCVYATPAGIERYKGETGIGVGVDFNWDRHETIRFAVLAAAQDASIGAHALAGKYVGGKASVTFGLGAGAAALIGGSSRNIALQPLGLENSSGFGLSGGLGYLFLEPVN